MKLLPSLAPLALIFPIACKSQPQVSPEADLLADLRRGTGELDAAHPPVVSLADAIDIARRFAPEGRLFHAELGRGNGRYDCLASFWSGDGLHFVHVDVQSGTLLPMASPDSAEDAHVRELGEQRRTLVAPSQVIASATEGLKAAWARSISLEGSFAEPVYSVEIVAGPDVRTVWVSATNGSLVQPPPNEN
jgi:hypothetical protein